MSVALGRLSHDAPVVELEALDTVWFQVGGTICNLRCHHCFISCAPENDKFGFMSLAACKGYLAEAVRLGVKEYYFTGGEPFANPEMCDILAETVKHGPATVLTNGTLLRPTTLRRLRDINESTVYSVELRVSIDGYDAGMNDPIRGDGTFAAAMQGVSDLVAHGFLPIITITRTWEGCDDEVLAGFVAALQRRGYARPRLKVLPSLKLGAEVRRTRGYYDDERVTREMMAGMDPSQLVCSSSRLVTGRGVWVCPILPDAADARLGATLRESLGPYPLRHHACFTCYAHGAICSNASTSAGSTTDA